MRFIYLDTPDGVIRGLDKLVETALPALVGWQGGQSFLNKDDLKRRLELIGRKMRPRYV